MQAQKTPQTPELRDRFEGLLFTYELLETKRGHAPSVPKTDSTEERLELEDLHGDGHYPDRLESLDTILGYFDRKNIPVDYEQVFEVLAEVKRRYALHHLKARQMEASREYADDLDVASRKVRDWLKKLRPLLHFHPSLERVRQSLSLPHPYQQEQDAVETLLSSEVLNNPPDHPQEYVFPKAGRRPQPFLKKADQELREAGVKPKEMRDGLLKVVGVKQWDDPEASTK